MSRDLSLIHPHLRSIVTRLILTCNDVGLPVLITDGFRSKSEQDKLYAQGRTIPGRIVTQVKYPSSAHNWGIAVDFCRNVRGREFDDTDGFFERVAEIAKPLGLEWGGDWKRFVDKPHLQMPQFMPNNSTSWLKQKYKTPENFRLSWTINQDKKEDDVDMERFKTIKDVPGYAFDIILELMAKGIIVGDGNDDLMKREINLSEDQIRTIIFCKRMIESNQD